MGMILLRTSIAHLLNSYLFCVEHHFQSTFHILLKVTEVRYHHRIDRESGRGQRRTQHFHKCPPRVGTPVCGARPVAALLWSNHLGNWSHGRRHS